MGVCMPRGKNPGALFFLILPHERPPEQGGGDERGAELFGGQPLDDFDQLIQDDLGFFFFQKDRSVTGKNANTA